MTRRDRLVPLLRGAAAAGVAIAVAGLVLAALGYSPVDALRALASGSIGSPAAWITTLLKTGPLLLSGLAVALCFRAGVWNIGAEGQIYAGALAATWFATRLAPEASVWLLLPATALVGALGGAALASIAGALRAWRGVSEVISTILLNFVAIQALSWAVHGPLQESAGRYPQSDALPAAALLPALSRLHIGIAIACVLAVVVTLVLFRTRFGLRLRAVGLSPLAARFAGISPERHLVAVLMIAGALAGLAGAFEVTGVTGRLYERLSPGYGYTAIAVALLARLHPLAVLPSALFFGALEAGGGAMQREAGIPSVATDLVKGVVILASVGLVFASGGRLPSTRSSESEAEAAQEAS